MASARRPETVVALPQSAGALLFMLLSLFLWITISPYVDLTGLAILDPSAGRSYRLNQIIMVSMTLGLLAYGICHPMRSVILQPRGLLAVLFLWLLAVSLISDHPMNGIKGIILTILTAANAAIYLLLPSSEKQFSKLIATVMIIMLGFAYFGIVFKPTLSIHQASELREPMNAGLWRGHLPHKNAAAAAMVFASFVGLYVASTWSRLIGVAILALSVFFLIHTGGKTSTAMMPAVLILSFFFEKCRWLRIPIAVGGVAAFNFLAVGSAVWPRLGNFVANLGVDATFTNRADIWRFAFDAISQRPITGYGFGAFWQTEELVHGGSEIETWAAAAANGHNSFLDTALSAGIPGLFLALCWVLFFPLRDLARMKPDDVRTPATRLFVRIWLFGLLNACLESMFFAGGSFAWFTFLVALNGFRLQSRAVIRQGTANQSQMRVTKYV